MPTFIACGARSGSTLLRFLIDSHPALACPPETDLGPLLQQYQRATENLRVEGEARVTADALFEEYLPSVGKLQWVDKSLSNALHLDLLAETFPDARFVLLHRNPMDFIANAIECQPWGLSEYGFLPYAAQSPGDSVGALARYWCDRAERMLAFERSHSERCLRLTYEDLVQFTETTLGALWSFLNVSPSPSAQGEAFSASHDAWGFGDHEIWYESGITDRDIGRGARIPPDKIRGDLRIRLNDSALKLGYEHVTDWWGSGGEVVLTPSSEDRAIRVMSGGRLVRYPSSAWDAGTDRPMCGLIVVEKEAIEPLKAGTLNIGSALRSRLVRLYGPKPKNYGEERALFEQLPKVL